MAPNSSSDEEGYSGSESENASSSSEQHAGKQDIPDLSHAEEILMNMKRGSDAFRNKKPINDETTVYECEGGCGFEDQVCAVVEKHERTCPLHVMTVQGQKEPAQPAKVGGKRKRAARAEKFAFDEESALDVLSNLGEAKQSGPRKSGIKHKYAKVLEKLVFDADPNQRIVDFIPLLRQKFEKNGKVDADFPTSGQIRSKVSLLRKKQGIIAARGRPMDGKLARALEDFIEDDATVSYKTCIEKLKAFCKREKLPIDDSFPADTTIESKVYNLKRKMGISRKYCYVDDEYAKLLVDIIDKNPKISIADCIMAVKKHIIDTTGALDRRFPSDSAFRDKIKSIKYSKGYMVRKKRMCKKYRLVLVSLFKSDPNLSLDNVVEKLKQHFKGNGESLQNDFPSDTAIQRKLKNLLLESRPRVGKRTPKRFGKILAEIIASSPKISDSDAKRMVVEQLRKEGIELTQEQVDKAFAKKILGLRPEPKARIKREPSLEEVPGARKKKKKYLNVLKVALQNDHDLTAERGLEVLEETFRGADGSVDADFPDLVSVIDKLKYLRRKNGLLKTKKRFAKRFTDQLVELIRNDSNLTADSAVKALKARNKGDDGLPEDDVLREKFIIMKHKVSKAESGGFLTDDHVEVLKEALLRKPKLNDDDCIKELKKFVINTQGALTDRFPSDKMILSKITALRKVSSSETRRRSSKRGASTSSEYAIVMRNIMEETPGISLENLREVLKSRYTRRGKLADDFPTASAVKKTFEQLLVTLGDGSSGNGLESRGGLKRRSSSMCGKVGGANGAAYEKYWVVLRKILDADPDKINKLGIIQLQNHFLKQHGSGSLDDFPSDRDIMKKMCFIVLERIVHANSRISLATAKEKLKNYFRWRVQNVTEHFPSNLELQQELMRLKASKLEVSSGTPSMKYVWKAIYSQILEAIIANNPGLSAHAAISKYKDYFVKSLGHYPVDFPSDQQIKTKLYSLRVRQDPAQARRSSSGSSSRKRKGAKGRSSSNSSVENASKAAKTEARSHPQRGRGRPSENLQQQPQAGANMQVPLMQQLLQQQQQLQQQQLHQQMGFNQAAQVNAQLNYQAQLHQYLRMMQASGQGGSNGGNNANAVQSHMGVLQPQLAQAMAAFQLAQAQAQMYRNSQYKPM